MVFGFFWAVGLAILWAIGKEGREAGYLFNSYQAIIAIVMGLRVHAALYWRPPAISNVKCKEPFEFTPLSHPGNAPKRPSGEFDEGGTVKVKGQVANDGSE